MIEYISKDEMELRIENALNDAKAVDTNEYHLGVVKGLEIAKDIIGDIKIRSTFHGQWLEEKYLIGSKTWEARCSCCHSLGESSTVISENYNWCPNCGAKMGGEQQRKEKDNNVRHLTDEETAIYESWTESEAEDTGENIMDGEQHG